MGQAKSGHTIPPFDERLAAALRSPDLELALNRVLPALRSRREAVFATDDFPAIQADLTARRAATVARLPELLEQFKREAERVGAVVHLARDAAEAREIVGAIARERGVKLAVKGKSMATEEIALNEYLEESGVKVVETDLGEWIVQLAHDRPSHLLAPALHLTREKIAELFSREVGQPLPAEPEALVRVAREQLRQSFINADLGITGANMAIASTGTIVLVSNEGNSRMVTTLPPVHVAIFGIEKIVADHDEANALLKTLARSATGQKFATYVSYITGPSRSADIELSLTIGVHGPKELHLIVLDNGRWAVHADPRFREALHCIRCGACANVCPSYQVVGGHVFGYRYTGPIGLVLTALHHGLEHAAGPQSLCASCNACETVCPVGIPIARMILDVRRQTVEKRGLPVAKRVALRVLADPRTLDLATRAASLVQLPVTRGGPFAHLPFPPFSSLTNWRNLPAFARQPLRDRVAPDLSPLSAGDGATGRRGDGAWGEEGGAAHTPRPTFLAPRPVAPIPGSQAIGKRIAYFSGCITDRLYPEMGQAIIQVLEASGARVSFPREQSCCGLPAINAGDREAALAMARQTIEAMERALAATPADYILSGSTSCAVSMLQDYPRLFAGEPEWLARAQRLGEKIVDFITFVDRVAQLPAGALAQPSGVAPRLTVTYHDSCQSHNCLKLFREPRRIIREVLGLELAEMADSSQCCGFGGAFSMEHPRVAERVLRQKLLNIAQTGASVVVADNPGCIMQLRGGLNARRKPIRVLHLAELMAERLRGGAG